jgi:hypothetical protein
MLKIQHLQIYIFKKNKNGIKLKILMDNVGILINITNCLDILELLKRRY